MLPLGLSMLWEKSVDPRAALSERFGFDSVDAVETWVTTALDETWGLSVIGCSRIAISDHNAIVWTTGKSGGLVVKWSRARELFPRLEASTRVLRMLGDQGLPVAAPIATLEGRVRATLDSAAGPLSVTVLPELTGNWLDISDKASVRSAGAQLAEVHRVLGRMSDADFASPPKKRLPERIEQWLEKGDRGFALDASHAVRDCLRTLPALDDRPQLVHNDFRAANVLTQNSQVAGILDFDEIVCDHRVNDLAKASVYLGTRFTDWRPTPAESKQTFRAGYESVRPLGPAEAQWLDVLVRWHSIMAIPSADDAAGWANAVGTSK